MPVRFQVRIILAWLALAVPTTIWSIVTSWNVLYDDAYISFRYAQHLGTGSGLTWNPGEDPTEGFTNLLLVLVLAPTSGLGFDPLAVTRALSLLALMTTCLLIFIAAYRWLGVSHGGALVAGLVFSIVPAAQLLVLSGMETVLFTALLAGASLAGVRLIRLGGVLPAFFFALLGFAAYLTRPEGALIVPALMVGLLATWRTLKATRWKVFLGLATLTALILIHLVWRIQTFDSLLPNPYYLKSASVLITASGATSVVVFIASFAVATLAALATITCWHSSGLSARAADHTLAIALISTCSALVVLYLAFVMRTDTITDISGRFAFPVLPLLLMLGAPAIGQVVDALLRANRWRAIVSWFALATGMSLLAGLPLGTLTTAMSPGFLRGASDAMAEQLNSNQQLRLANAFAEIRPIVSARVAYGDAGLVPYVSGLPWLDLVGLNDSTLARATSREVAVDYVFGVAPEIFLIPVDDDGALYRSGHGILGDYGTWARDSRWSAYEYLGTFKRNDAPYDLLLLARQGALPDLARNVLTSELDLVCTPVHSRLMSVSDPNNCD